MSEKIFIPPKELREFKNIGESILDSNLFKDLFQSYQQRKTGVRIIDRNTPEQFERQYLLPMGNLKKHEMQRSHVGCAIACMRSIIKMVDPNDRVPTEEEAISMAISGGL